MDGYTHACIILLDPVAAYSGSSWESGQIRIQLFREDADAAADTCPLERQVLFM